MNNTRILVLTLIVQETAFGNLGIDLSNFKNQALTWTDDQLVSFNGTYDYASDETDCFDEPVEQYPEYSDCNNVEPECENLYVWSVFLEAKHIEGGGIGYNQGYSSLNVRAFPIVDCYGIFFDLRNHWFNNGRFAGNYGLGFRQRIQTNLAIGINGYCDLRYAYGGGHGTLFSQGGLGIEVLSPCFDLRANGYWPTRKRHLLRRCHWDTYSDGYFLEWNKNLIALQGYDFELGFFKRCIYPFDVYSAIGAYYYGVGAPRDTWGVRFRLNLALRYFSLEGIVTHDSIFKTKVQGQIAFTIPIKNFCYTYACDQFMYQPVQRNEIIVFDKNIRWDWNY